jgi:hypothetical protein
MAVTENSYTGNGSTTNYSFTFPYLKSTDVQVQVDATVTTAWQFANATTVQFNTAPANGAKIKILRDTNVDSLAATFYAGSSIKSEDLNDNYTQNLYKTQEVGARYFSTTGGTMTGDLTLGEDVTLTFEGATDNAHETKLTVADPTADRTITFPDTTGTVITTGDTGTVATGMIAADAVNGTKIADDSINSEHYVDGSIDTQHIADSQITTAKIADNNVTTAKIVDANITTAKIAADAVNGTKIADDSINSEHYVDGSIDTQHIADNQITTAKLVDNNVTADKLAHTSVTAGSYSAADITVDAQGRITAASSGAIATSEITDGAVTTAKLGADSVTGAKIADDQINSEHYVAGSIDHEHLANDIIDGDNIQNDVINSEHYVAGSIDTEHIADSQVTTAKLADSNVTTAKIAANAVTSAKIADDAVGSTELGDGVIDTVHIGSSQITTAKIADSNITTAKITDANVTTAKIADDAITIGKIGCEQTTISDSDSHIPTSGAVVDYVAAQLAPLGGFEAIANEQSFPNTQPASGVVISIADAGGLAVSNSGTASGQTVGGTTVNITGIASNFNGTTVAAGIRFLVASTGSGQNYTYHKATLKEDDLLSLSGDINDFAERYRIGSSNPTSSLDNGDLFFNTSTGKMLVYNGTNTAWEEVQSIGNFFISTLSPAFDGSTQNFTITNAPSNVQQVLLVINGVVQKPNSGTSTPSEGFALDGSTIKLGAAPAAGSTYHAVVIGSTVNIGTPSNNTVSTAILQDDSVTTAKIAASNVTATELGANAVITSKIADDAVTTAKIANDAITGDKIATNLDLPDNNKIRFGTGNDLEIYHDGSHTRVSHTGTGQLVISGNDNDQVKLMKGTSEEGVVLNNNGNVELYHNNSKKFETTSAGVTVTGDLTFSDSVANDINLRGGKIYGDDGALPAFTIQNTSGNANHAKIIIGASNSDNGGIEFYGAGSSSSDLKMTIRGNTDTVEIPDNHKFVCGDGSDLQIYHDGNNSVINNDTGGLYIKNDGVIEFQKASSGETKAKFISDGAVELYHDNSKKLETTSTGIQMEGNINVRDNHKVQLGNNQDLQIYHTGSTNRIETSGQIQMICNNLSLANAANSESLIQAFQDGAVNLFYDGSKKLETTSGGVTVTGNVSGSLASNFTLVDFDAYDSATQTSLVNDQQWYTDTGLGTRTISNYQRGQLIIIRAQVPMGIALSNSSSGANYAMAKTRIKLTNGSANTYTNDSEVWYRADGAGTHESTQARNLTLVVAASNTDFSNGDNLTVSIEGFRRADAGSMSAFIGGWNSRKQVTIERYARQLA